jgi:dipeptidase D
MKRVIEIFEELSRVPRPSKKEEKVRDWVLEYARKAGYAAQVDGAGNVLLRVPATPGCESGQTVVLQGHLDMVCEKRPSSSHNFETDSLVLEYDGEWLTARDTTLGADNGIAIALALAFAADGSAKHPPLELLFTVDEETGLTGATNIDGSLLSGKVLLNLDSEEPGSFVVGCAGGRSSTITLPKETGPASSGESPWRISVTGLAGGHSGVDIKLQRGNANVLLGRSLRRLRKMGSLRVARVSGGNAHNAIPREAEAVVVIDSAVEKQLLAEVERLNEAFRRELVATDPQATVVATKEEALPQELYTREATAALTDMLVAIPNGVYRYSDTIPGLVAASANLATLSTDDKGIKILVSQRSSSKAHLEALTEKISAIAEANGAQATSDGEYASWEPNFDADIVRRSKEAYSRLFGAEPEVEVIHAGLEAGVIGDKYPGMEMISFGPRIEQAHSPDERLHLPSVEPTYRLLAEIVGSYC